ncbi:hypothetical protein EGW08_020920 [Elysia chlorotica]|uniref:Uncharacterized protein n=1 Tax=Elysia chlorotica TaxID=188477 RepID=A0A433SQ30_ELYCH|nr:hypothetical protein EGW08_020920 [Elysia chlorotica]
MMFGAAHLLQCLTELVSISLSIRVQQSVLPIRDIRGTSGFLLFAPKDEAAKNGSVSVSVSLIVQTMRGPSRASRACHAFPTCIGFQSVKIVWSAWEESGRHPHSFHLFDKVSRERNGQDLNSGPFASEADVLPLDHRAPRRGFCVILDSLKEYHAEMGAPVCMDLRNFSLQVQGLKLSTSPFVHTCQSALVSKASCRQLESELTHTGAWETHTKALAKMWHIATAKTMSKHSYIIESWSQ